VLLQNQSMPDCALVALCWRYSDLVVFLI